MGDTEDDQVELFDDWVVEAMSFSSSRLRLSGEITAVLDGDRYWKRKRIENGAVSGGIGSRHHHLFSAPVHKPAANALRQERPHRGMACL